MLYKHICCIRLFIRSFIVVKKKINVSSTKLIHMLDFLDTSSMGVTFGWSLDIACRELDS
jgi:hypothetical protein